MLLRSVLPAAKSTTFRRRICGSRRTFLTETVQTLSNAYLDLAVALPYPPTWPVYSSTIILFGVTSRLAILPLFIWAQKRSRRVEESVIPYLKVYRAKLEDKARIQIEAAKATNDSEAASKHFAQVVVEKLKEKRKELFKEHGCTPWVTILVPPMVQLPIFFTLTSIFYQAAGGSSSVLRDEAFLTLSSLAHSDPTMTLPVVLGLVTLASIDTSSWFLSADHVKRMEARQRTEEAQKAQGKLLIQPSVYTKNILRGVSIARIVVAAMSPGSIQVYWLTSATFGLFQNWALNWSTSRKAVHAMDGSKLPTNRITPRLKL